MMVNVAARKVSSPRFLLCALGCLAVCLPAGAANYTTTAIQGVGVDWNASAWQLNGAGAATVPTAGNSYACIANGAAFGNNKNNTRIRNPAASGIQTFPGDVLVFNTNSEIRIKGPGAILNFPGVGGNPGVILNGGVINVGDDAVFTITGSMQANNQSYICPGDNGGGAAKPLRGVNVAAKLSGSGTLVIFQATTNVAQEFSSSQNTFAGNWIVKAGWLLGSGTGSLGSGNITVDPLYALPLDSSILNVPGPAAVEINYDINSPGILTLTNGGVFRLHQNCIFQNARIEGADLPYGYYSYAYLLTNFPASFYPGGSGGIFVQHNSQPPMPPQIQIQPTPATIYQGGVTQLVTSVTGAPTLSFLWQKGTNGAFVYINDGGDVLGSKTNALSFTNAMYSDSADYRLVVTNNFGAITSQVASLVVLNPTVPPMVVSLNPPAGSTVGSLTQIQVRFDRVVTGIQPENILVNGAPASQVSGGGSNYVFTFSQPVPGAVLVYWDIETAVTDLLGNPFPPTNNWTYTLIDNAPPTIISAAPTAGATVSQLTQARVEFSEPVSGVDASDLLVNGQPALSVIGGGFGPYVFSFPAPPTGMVQFAWAASHGIRDLSSSSNLFVASGWSVLLDPPAASAALTNLVINEFLTANTSLSGLKDEDGQLSDWLEIFNRGPAMVNLTGWGLTGDPDNPGVWNFPATNINAGEYLVVFCSAKDRRLPGQRLHSNFELNSSGEYLGLFNADFPALKVHDYSPAYPEQRNGISYGLNLTNAPGYFLTPTPGYGNAGAMLSGVVPPVHFSVKHGFFNQPFQLVLATTTPGATILCTTNGSNPGINGTVTNGFVCNGPIAVNHTTALRAAGFAAGKLPSLVGSQTYIFPEDVVHQPNEPEGYPIGNVWTPTPNVVASSSRAYYQMGQTIVNDPQYAGSVRSGLTSIPTMAITIPIPDLFDPNTGIYTHPQDRGAGWERACSMELIYPDGSDGAQVDCGLQIQGGTQRDPNKSAKHSFRVNFKGAYGAAKFHHPIFPDTPVTSFNTFVLDGGINYWWHYAGASGPADQRYRAQCVRDQFVSDLMLAMGHPSFHGKFFHLYLNGLYWGIQYIHERTDEDFAASYFGGNSEDYDVIKNTTFGTQVVSGDLNAWNTALSLANSGLANNSQYEQLQQYIDIDNFIDYMIVNHWSGNDDWPQHNWYLIRKRAPGAGFKFLIWDAEHVLKGLGYNNTTADSTGSPAQIYNALRAYNAEFRLRFADHLQKHFFNGGVLYTDPVAAKAIWDPMHPEKNIPASYYIKRINEIDTAIVDESARWGGYLLNTNYTRNDHWLRELNNLLGYATNSGNTSSYFPLRSTNVLSQYRSIGLLPSVSAPVLSLTGGHVAAGYALTMTNRNGAGTIYYTTDGSDPRLYGSGAVAPGAKVYTGGTVLAVNNSQLVRARVLNGAWSALNEADFTVASLGVPVRITEFMYNAIGGEAYEFIELRNFGAGPVDLSGYNFDGVSYIFPNGSVLPAGGILVLSSSANPSAFASRYPGVIVAGAYGGALNNTGEQLALLDPAGNSVMSVDYKNSGGWPAAANGGGYSLEINDPNGDPDDPANWRASSAFNGTPGIYIPYSVTNTIVLNEVMADNAGLINNGGTFPDWVELRNVTSNDISIANWSFSNSGNARKYVFSAGTTISAGDHLVVWCDSATAAPGLHSGFNLGKSGENLFLYDASTNRVDAFSFGLQLPNYTVGRIGAGSLWQLNQPTPGSNNIPAAVASPTNLFINEWLANVPSGGSDWLELYNASSLPAALSGLYLGTSNSLFQSTAVSFLPPGGYVQLFADKNPGVDHVDFKLTAAGDSITLFDSTGQQIDRVAFVNQVENVSQGRLPDGGANIVSFTGSSSPGATNYISAYAGPIINEVMARNVSAVYDSRGNNPDWIEFQNPGASAFSLAGFSLGLNTDGSGKWLFPGGASVPGNGYLVVWFDSSRPASTNVEPELNFGQKLSGSGGSMVLYDANGQVADTISFGFQLADFSIGRTGGAWKLLASPSPGAANSAAASLGPASSLRINEWMANPLSGDDWVELFNTASSPVSLAGLYLSDDPSIAGITNSRIAALSFIGARDWAQFIADGSLSKGPDHVGFSLSSSGETIWLSDASVQRIDSVDFGLQDAGVSQGRLPDGGTNIVSFTTTPTPDKSNYLPLQSVRINEVLTHTDPPLEDAIELYNPTAGSVSIGGWFLSNSENHPKKCRIPPGTSLSSGGYAVFYEAQFNTTNATPFTLNSAHGDQVLLSEADAQGNLTGYRAQVGFPAAEHGVSFGIFHASTGDGFVAMAARTFGADNPASLAEFRTGTGLANSAPKIGPVVINEIMYHPISVIGGVPTENASEEYVELLNISSNAVPLYDPDAPTNHWKLSGAVDYTFPSGVMLAQGSYLLAVNFDPALDPVSLAAFRAKYGLGANITIYGPYSGQLDNAGESVELYKPDPPQMPPHPDVGFVPYILADRVNYLPSAPWPAGADGAGQSLQRLSSPGFGDEPLNWIACAPNPGAPTCAMDSDGDGLPDDWELANSLNPNSAAGDDGANGDPDRDGFTNLQEYQSGTNPRDPNSYLKIDSAQYIMGGAAIHFTAVAGHSYTIQYTTNLTTGIWQHLQDVDAPASNTAKTINDLSSGAMRFYRLTTPKTP